MGDQEPNTPADKSSDERKLIEDAVRQAEEAKKRSDADPDFGFSLPPDDTFDGYDLIREIHRGGQGIVYLALQNSTNRKVAIKVLKEGPFAGTSGRARFSREIQVLGQLNHPNIVDIHDSGVTGSGNCFYVMDYIAGCTLDEHMRQTRDQKLGETLQMFAKICAAVSAAHLRGIIHRDIKPANVRINEEGEPILVDFGLAKITLSEVGAASRSRPMTVTGQFVGSLPWASPEQAEGAANGIDIRTDVYSLGVILYQVITGGEFPYAVIGSMRDVLDNILRAEPARPSSTGRKINDEVETIVLKCLSKERDRRYQSAGELERDIRHYLAGEPIEAKSDSGWYVIRKTLNRYRPWVGAGIAAAMLVIASLVIISLMYQRSEVNRARAVQNFDAVRALAHTFMFDFYDEVGNLVGGTSAQKLIIEEAQRYLASLSDQASDDPEFLAELATAHARLGDLLAGPGAHGAGDLERGASHYEEAAAIRAALLDQSPDSWVALRDVAESTADSAWVLQVRQEYAMARDAWIDSVAQFDEASERAPETEQTALTIERTVALRNRALAISRLAQLEDDDARRIALLDEAMLQYDTVSRRFTDLATDDPASARIARELAMSIEQSANVLVLAAEAEVDRSASAPDTSAALDRALELCDRANSLAQRSVELLEPLVRSAPQHADLQRSLFVAWHALGRGHTRIARAFEELAPDRTDDIRAQSELSLDAYRNALGITERLAAGDTGNLRARRDIAMCLNKIGNELLRLGALDEAETHYLRSLETRLEYARTDPSNLHTQDVGIAQFKLGDLASARADAALSEPEIRAHLILAIERYTQCQRQFDQLVAQGVMARTSPFYREVDETIQRTQSRLSAL